MYEDPAIQGQIVFVAERLLPKIFNVHENNIQGGIRSKTLIVIDKILLLFGHELLQNFIEPYSFAKFISSNLRAGQLNQIHLCLQMVSKLMKSNPETFTMPLVREGVVSFIAKHLTSMETLEALLGNKLTEVE